MAKAGAKAKYDTVVKPYLEEIKKKVRAGVTEAAIAKALGISVATLNNYKNKHAAFREALSKDKGADVLQDLVNAGIEAARGYFRDEEITTIVLDENGDPAKKQKVVKRTWFPPNAQLNKFYVMNYGKQEGFTNDPLEMELKQAKRELEEAEFKMKNWDGDIDF